MAKLKGTEFFDMEVRIPEIISALRARWILKKSDLKAFRVPADLQESVLRRLVEEGFEAIKGGVRLPLRLQVETLLNERTVLSGSIGKHLIPKRFQT